MADEIINDVQNEEVVKETTKAEDTKEELTEDMPDSSGNKPDDGPSVVRKAMEKLGILKAKESTEEVANTEEGDLIPDEFIKAASEQGWTDKDIVDFAGKYTDDELKEMIPFLYEDDTEVEEEKDTPKKDSETQDTTKDIETKEEALKALKEEIRKEFKGELDSLKERLGEVDKARDIQKIEARLEMVNRAFDKAGEEFEVFGKTEELPVFPSGPKKGQIIPTAPAVKARKEVYSKAVAFMNSGSTVDDAMQDALTWYKGKYLVTDVKRGVIKDLKKNEQKLSAKRSRKETVKTYEDEDERRAAFIREQADKLGIKLAEE